MDVPKMKQYINNISNRIDCKYEYQENHIIFRKCTWYHKFRNILNYYVKLGQY